MANKSPKQHKASKLAPKNKGQPAAKGKGKDKAPPPLPKPATKAMKLGGSETESPQPQAKKRKSDEVGSIAALAMQAGRAAAEASPKKRSRAPEDLPSPQAEVIPPLFSNLYCCNAFT